MNISFIIPTYNSQNTIEQCIISIKRQMKSNDEIIVIDNGSDDQTLDILKSFNIQVTQIIYDANVSELRNIAAERSENQLLAFIDSDCVLGEEWRENVISMLANRISDATGSKYALPTNANWIEKAWFSQRFTGISDINYINSGNFIIKKSIFQFIGGFNPKLITGEDSEFCARLRRAGFRILSNDAIKAIHLGNPKNIFQFFRKQLWHSLGAFGSAKISFLDKPVIATISFVFLSFFSIFAIFKSNYYAAFFLILLIPFLTVIYRSYQYKCKRFFFQLILLYLIFYFSRMIGLFKVFYLTAIKRDF